MRQVRPVRVDRAYQRQGSLHQVRKGPSMKLALVLGAVLTALITHLFFTPHYGNCQPTDIGTKCTLTHYTLKEGK